MTRFGTNSRHWINRGPNGIPDWLIPHVAQPREPNGSFEIRSKVGKADVVAKVHVGHAVILHRDIAYTRILGEADELIAELEEMDRAVPAPVGPGKNVDKACAAKTPAARGRAAGKVKPTERKRAYPEPLGDPPTIEWIKVDRLSIDAVYQRSTDNDASRRLIASIAANFDWRLCAPLVVSRRPDGTLSVIDGQHRTVAAKMRGDIPHMPCCVFNYSSPEEEARMFISANRARKPMNRLDDFHAALAAADEDALEINRLVTEAGLTITRNTSSSAWKPGEIAFTASIASTLRKHGEQIVSAALTNIAEAFPGQKVVHSGSIFLGIVKMLTSPPEGFDPDRMFQALLRYSAEEWGSFVTGLKGGDTRATAIRDALLMAYEEVPVISS
ncbi:ParB N-terminal domain-containing protein [Novosphingobium sp. FGD1]|uniref:ParB N-terminal domain-containing protein n=1 Tax=Novosphingobium silvae TaxID=2692619 RepID=A0A7X4GGH4_9SPHN|nr:DUF6551 family protein [Novosphingobium silvae]MYL97925.1 ParB N-terminal domain-containing protein [Novosphingobium silvae]